MPLRSLIPTLASLLFLTTACSPEGRPTDNVGKQPASEQGRADAGVGPATFEVRGVIVGGDDGLPLDRSVTVLINGAEAIPSNADGTFRIEAVQRPYDVTVLDASGDVAITYLQVSRPDPTLVLPHASRSGYQEASLSGVVEGGSPAETPNLKTAVLIDLPGAVWPRWTPAEADGSYSLSFDWVGESTIDVPVAALQYVLGVNGTPAEFGYGAVTEIKVGSGDVLENVRLELSPTPGDPFLSGTTRPRWTAKTGQ